MLYYLDTSSVLKLFLEERESRSFRKFLMEMGEPKYFHYSFMTRLELLRNLRNLDLDLTQAKALLEGWTSIRATKEVLNLAESVNPENLKTPDAIHLASALLLSPLKVTMITYDKQLAKASLASGIQVVSPGS